MKFKNSIAIRGNKALLRAFSEELNGLEYKLVGENIDNYTGYKDTLETPMYITTNTSHACCKNGEYTFAMNNGAHSDSDYYALPQDWDKALELAKEVEEEIPEYIKCTGSAPESTKFTYNKIYKLEGGSDNKRYNIKDNHGKICNLPINGGVWIWVPSTKAEFDAQELEYKKQELLSEAKRRYPVGCKFEVVHRKGTIWQVTSHSTHDDTFVNNRGLHINLLGKCIKGEDDGCISASVYFNGAWAEIVKDEFKVEDWIKVQNIDGSDSDYEIVKLKEYCPNSYIKFKYNGGQCSNARLATPEEIAKVKEDTIEIAGYTAKFDDERVAFGYKEFSNEDLKAIKRVNELSISKGVDFKFEGCQGFIVFYDDKEYIISDTVMDKLINKTE